MRRYFLRGRESNQNKLENKTTSELRQGKKYIHVYKYLPTNRKSVENLIPNFGRSQYEKCFLKKVPNISYRGRADDVGEKLLGRSF